ncbi:Clavaminate synthase-like protein [Patellaria atrata CBS 101060]|uniref:Clavaminate synthase-like protein n=1 Tax=Patellaria atrata CBS 101060 TaxID=1346257 RepID=A0A9P4S8N3_9PEZI|nr:Clavaminate synthase-like protein [Patellaria atrata CBS 101060]
MNGDSANIPVIDISSPTVEVAKALVNASSTYGFVFVKNNDIGIPPQDISDMFELSKTFFQSPVEIKEECSINSAKSGKNRGWLSMHTETLDPSNQKKGDYKEAFNFGEFVNGKADQPLPGPLAAREDDIGQFIDKCHNLCIKILDLFAIGLEIPESAGGPSFFTTRHDRSKGPSGSVFRLLYYPTLPFLPTDPLDIRAGAHSDYGSITLLFQLPGQPGLEILTPSNTWASVPVDPSPSSNPNPSSIPILVNIGDLLSYWTAGLLKSTVHRVIFPYAEENKGAQDRYSIAYFCHPLDDATLVPVPGPVVEEHVKRAGEEMNGAPMTAREHLNARLEATYGAKVKFEGSG